MSLSLTQCFLLSGVYLSHHRSEEVHSPLSSPARRRRSSQWPTSSPSTLASSLSLADHVFPMRMMVVSTSKNSQLGLFWHCSVIHLSFTKTCVHHYCIWVSVKGIFGPTYEECLEKIKQQYVTATAIGSMVGK